MQNIKLSRQNSLTKSKAGFSLVELLISMAIFGVIMLGLNSMLIANSKATQNQSSAAETTVAAKQSLLRISDIVAQAHYIYPSEQAITVIQGNGDQKTITTGTNALAVLLPEGSTYCPGNGHKYCGYIISIENRSSFSNLLGASSHSTNLVLAGWRAFGLIWPQYTVPTNVLDTWTNVQKELLVDSVVAGGTANQTDLGSSARLYASRTNTQFDDDQDFSILAANKNQADGLIASIEPRIVVAYGTGNNRKEITRSSHIFARAVPRGSLPNPD